MELITDLTACHTYYVNVLGERLFQSNTYPDLQNIRDYWNQICLEEQGNISRSLEFLTPKQKQLLIAIAAHPKLKEPTGKEFMKGVNMTPKAVLDGLKVLYQHDLIEKTIDSEIVLIDPVFVYWASLHYS